ncbi:MAG TPA: amidase [Caulobacteraceae bacterium]|nr:amidase [Caulobacteraceae bacterium]
MTFANPIIEAGVSGLCDLYTDRAVTPVEACEVYLSRIDGLDGGVGAYAAVDAEGARSAAHASAERWRHGKALSRLDGLPLAVKCNIAVEGLPWHAGIDAYRDRIAPSDAACTARLREAGAVILGTLNMHEAAFGGTSDNPWFGRVHNPWAHDFIPGGSSGGSAAAVAAGLCAGALGTDTLGSVRIPSALCGVFGHKPTIGLIPLAGVVALSWTLDHVGVHARSADDCGRLLAGASGAEAELAAEISQPAALETLRQAPMAALVWDGVEVEDEVRKAYEAAIAAARAAGLEVEMLRLEGYDFADRSDLHLICAAEASVEHADALVTRPGGFSPALMERLHLARDHSAADLARAYRDLAVRAEQVREQLSPFAGLLLPATPRTATPFDAPAPVMTQFTALANALGLPATVFPVGVSNEGRPIGCQALTWEDETSLGLARLLGRDLGGPPAFRG